MRSIADDQCGDLVIVKSEVRAELDPIRFALHIELTGFRLNFSVYLNYRLQRGCGLLRIDVWRGVRFQKSYLVGDDHRSRPEPVRAKPYEN